MRKMPQDKAKNTIFIGTMGIKAIESQETADSGCLFHGFFVHSVCFLFKLVYMIYIFEGKSASYLERQHTLSLTRPKYDFPSIICSPAFSLKDIIISALEQQQRISIQMSK